MDIEYSFTRSIPPDDLRHLFAQAEWMKTRTLSETQHVLAHSLCLGAWYGDQLVGFARAMTDGLFYAYIEDVIVDAARRGEGIGLGLLRTLLDRLIPVQEIMLDCEAHMDTYYAQLGFTPHPGKHLHICKSVNE